MQTEFANRVGDSQILLFAGDCGRNYPETIVLHSDGARRLLTGTD
jgi:hypothetical protein